MKIKTPKAAYAVISQDGSRYSVSFIPKGCTTHEVSGYNFETILDRAPVDGITVIDWRHATFQSALKFTNMGTPRETDKAFGSITLAQYFDNAKKLGAKIITVKSKVI